MQNERNMPIGVQSFPSMIEGNYLYVDKTQFIPKLEKLGRAYFLARPRRFGKSLFLSTLQAYFEGRKELFKGFAIEKFKEETGSEWQSYPILKLDLNAKEYVREKDLDEILTEHIDKWKSIYDIDCEYKSPESAFAYIIETLYQKFNKRVVILIDEYDKPILDNITDAEMRNYARSVLKGLYEHIKYNDEYVKFAFLTGVSKFSKVSIFSGLNNIIDISLRAAYGNICGYTQTDLETTLQPYLVGVDMGKVKRWYDGYNF